MALFVPDSVPRTDLSQRAQHFVPPSARERRAQAVHRLQVGLFGLAGMLLLVGLANIIMDRARISQNAPAASSQAAVTAAQVGPDAVTSSPITEPLADIGVVPDLPSATNSATASPTAAAPLAASPAPGVAPRP